MIESLLVVTEENFNLSSDDIPEDVWAGKVKVMMTHFMEIFDNIMFPPVQALLAPVPFPHSTHEVIWTKQSTLKIVTSRFRPTNEYYRNSGEEIPQPENPNGCHAAGVSLEAHLFSAFSSKEYCQNASITVDFEIWGRKEREKFDIL